MGQKVHPLGFRVGITKKHQSQWFARFQKYSYSQSVYEDHMLRKTLLNLFSNIQMNSKDYFDKNNPLATKQTKKQGATASKTPKITQIKIERGLIPYEIGIQIHSDDCLAITKAIDNIKFSTDLVSNLQKTRKYLFKAGAQLKKALYTNLTENNARNEVGNNQLLSNSIIPEALDKGELLTKTLKKRNFKIKKVKTKQQAIFKSKRKQKKKLSKTIFMRLKNIKRRFKKRQIIKKSYLNMISKGLLMRKKGNLIIRNVKIKPLRIQTKNKKSNFLQASFKNNKTNKTLLGTKPKEGAKPLINKNNFVNIPKTTLKNEISKQKKISVVQTLNTNKNYKKFANLFLTKLNKQFLICLKGIMKYWHNQKLTQAPLGYNKKWHSAKSFTLIKNLKAKYFSKDTKGLANYQVEKLTKFIFMLEKKSLIKMETLRKDYITFGTISKTRAFGYYQIITFLKSLKELVTKINKQNMVTANGTGVIKSNTKQTNANTDFNNLKQMSNKLKIQNLIRAKSKQKKIITQTVVNNYINLVHLKSEAMTNELRKIKWITYLKNLINKHRTENIFFYLATIANARKDLKTLKHYIKQHSNFLFGINIENIKDNPNALLQRVTKTLTQSTKNKVLHPLTNNIEALTSLQKAFLTIIESQRKMYKANLALTPKISIKFFSVKTTDVLEKASIVADSIVDALEKRKPFRGVIKKAKEDLMRRPRVKGVKIQVSGRLNGAEIARSEWVRAGRVPLQTLRANIDYSYTTANTIYGIIGVKVWIFKGYSKIN
uniref:Small ribosomal subunit protein uS3c n=1 Tax=Astrephomene gubernaculifera TaxID=47775 RepID=A0A7R6ZMV1_9CHLO|nr:ribosomal protein S3 [Astrephomene gubernaculifera]